MIPAEAHAPSFRPIRYHLTAATVAHVYELAETMRQKDKDEILGLGVGIKRVLWRSYKNSLMCRAAIVDGRVAAVWGLGVGLRPGVTLLSDIAVPWLHTSALVEQLPVSFLRVAKGEVAAMRRMRPKLESYVDAAYPQAVRLVSVLGFTVDEPKPIGVGGRLYHRFHMGFD